MLPLVLSLQTYIHQKLHWSEMQDKLYFYLICGKFKVYCLLKAGNMTFVHIEKNS